jgi:NAD+ kinase
MAAVALVVHTARPEAGTLATEMAEWLEAHGHDVRITASDAGPWPTLARFQRSDDDVMAGAQLVVSVGGDGTMLRAVHAAVPSGVPVLGVNVGHLGYLTEVEPKGWREALERFFAGDYHIAERTTLDVELCRDGSPSSFEHRIALNDAVVEKLEAGHTVRLGVAIDDQPFLSYAADGLIVATPTGSTAYNLSAGGPIISPALAALVVTPVAPHLLFDRSMVLGPGEGVRLEVLSGLAALSVDGQPLGRLTAGDSIMCRAAARSAHLVEFGVRDFRRVLKAKFGLGEFGLR